MVSTHEFLPTRLLCIHRLLQRSTYSSNCCLQWIYTRNLFALQRLAEMEAPNVLQFTTGGDRIFASGFHTDRTIHKFDVSRPGRDSDILRLGKTRRSKDGQKGIVSAIAFPAMVNSAFAGSNVFAVGTYSPGSIYVYDDRLPNDDPAGIVMDGGIGVVGHGKNFGRKKRRFESTEEDGEQDLFSAAKKTWWTGKNPDGSDPAHVVERESK